MIGKRQRVARALNRIRFDRLTLRAQPRTLVVLTYHRVLNPLPKDYPFDDGVAEHSADTFEAQLRWLARHTRVLSEDELLDVVEHRRTPRGPLSVITVDDAYVDAYEVVLPILKSVGLPAVFFVPIEPVQTRRLGWWDLIAFSLKNSLEARVEFEGMILHPARDSQTAIARVGRWFKTRPTGEAAALVGSLAEACGVELPSPEAQDEELATWSQLREIVRAGMAVGAHTLSHRVLDTLEPTERREEIAQPKTILEDELGVTVRSIGFPGAGSAPVSRETIEMARDASYRMAFLPNVGAGNTKTCRPLEVPRVGAPTTLDGVQSLVAYPWLMT